MAHHPSAAPFNEVVMRIWVTRTAPDNLLSAERLRRLGHDALVVPVLKVRPVHSSLLCSPDGLVFTSSNGVRNHSFSPELSHLPVFAVGDRTAESAIAAGYRDVRSAGGAVAELEALIAEQLEPPATIVHFCASQPAGDLSGALERLGIRVERVTAYRTEPCRVDELDAVRSALPSIDGIVVHSPRAALKVAQFISAAGWSGRIWCISAACITVIASVLDARRLSACKLFFAVRPEEAALIDLIGHASVRRPVVACASVGEVLRWRLAFTRTASPPAAMNDDAADDPPTDDGPSAA